MEGLINDKTLAAPFAGRYHDGPLKCKVIAVDYHDGPLKCKVIAVDYHDGPLKCKVIAVHGF